jgi:hypothetical protein
MFAALATRASQGLRIAYIEWLVRGDRATLPGNSGGGGDWCLRSRQLVEIHKQMSSSRNRSVSPEHVEPLGWTEADALDSIKRRVDRLDARDDQDETREAAHPTVTEAGPRNKGLGSEAVITRQLSPASETSPIDHLAMVIVLGGALALIALAAACSLGAHTIDAGCAIRLVLAVAGLFVALWYAVRVFVFGPASHGGRLRLIGVLGGIPIALTASALLG